MPHTGGWCHWSTSWWCAGGFSHIFFWKSPNFWRRSNIQFEMAGLWSFYITFWGCCKYLGLIFRSDDEWWEASSFLFWLSHLVRMWGSQQGPIIGMISKNFTNKNHDFSQIKMAMDQYLYIYIIFRGMNIHLPAILMFTRGTRFWHTAKCPFPSDHRTWFATHHPLMIFPTRNLKMASSG